MNARLFLFGAGLMTVSFLCGIAFAVRFLA